LLKKGFKFAQFDGITNAVGGCESTRKSGCEAALLMDEVGESVPMALLRWPPAVLVG
jgi:hypothetical protein